MPGMAKRDKSGGRSTVRRVVVVGAVVAACLAGLAVGTAGAATPPWAVPHPAGAPSW